MNEDRLIAIMLLNAIIGVLMTVSSLWLALNFFSDSIILMYVCISGLFVMASGPIFVFLYYLRSIPRTLMKIWRVATGKEEQLY